MPNGHHYLLEVGTEELPKDFLLGATGELENKLRDTLSSEGIVFDQVAVYATPRRLTLSITGLPDMQTGREQVLKGPPIRVGLTADGLPSPAGQGFARKTGVEFSAFTQEEMDGEIYLVLRQTQAGRPVKEVLAECLPELILGLSGSHFMAWGSGTIRFSRPIRWLVSLWDDAHLPVTIGHVQSGTQSRGHRVMSDGEVTIPSAAGYLEALEANGAVLADTSRRRSLIYGQLLAEASRLGGQLSENEDLLDTVTMLVEKPFVLAGRFQDRFLEIPEEVTITVMAAHQKYFPVVDGDGRLMPNFLAVSNGRPECGDIIRHGNEKVITARLEDARFFFEDDQKIPLENRLENLKGITFQKGLGSMYEKALRLESLSLQVSEALGQDKGLRKQVARAARLAKADLVTGMVFEFTELQGAMGRRYAELAGEPKNVSEAIFEHYLPRFTGDIVARNPVGITVSLADKLDSLIAVFSQTSAKLPSGSKDPLGLRRMASGVIQTILENKLTIDLDALLRAAYTRLRESMPAPAEAVEKPSSKDDKKSKTQKDTFRDLDTTMTELTAFILQRFRGFLLDQGHRYDVIDAVLDNAYPPLTNLCGVIERLAIMKTLVADEKRLQALHEPANRIFKILGQNYDPAASLANVQSDALRHESERKLLDAVTAVSAPFVAAAVSPEGLVEPLVGLNHAITRFFEDVMVNDPDATVRKNRYNLLSVLNRFYLQLACFSRLTV